MGQIVNPTSLRLGNLRGWESNWVADKKSFAKNLEEDSKIRICLLTSLPKEVISKTIIDRTLKTIKITIHTSKPGLLIGSGGTKLAEVTKKLKKICNKEVRINVSELRRPDLDAKLVGEAISTQIKSYKRYNSVIKQQMANTMSAGAKGIRIDIAGRLGGAEIARTEKKQTGRVPLHTLRADIDYAKIPVKTSYGMIGLKIFIFKKYVYGKRDLSLNLEVRTKQPHQSRHHLARKNNHSHK